MTVRPERVVLDTSAYSWLRAGHAATRRLVAAAEVVYLPVTVLGELHAGFALGSRARDNEEALARFLARPGVRTSDITPGVARQYGAIFSALRRSGTPIPTNDIWIAAAALELVAHLVTFDADFECIDGLAMTRLEAST